MSDFWSKRLNGGAPAPPPRQSAPAYYQQAPAPAQQPRRDLWWMAAPPQPDIPSVDSYVPGRDGPSIEELARMDPFSLSQEALELIAAHKLKSNRKYDTKCPHCGAENGLMRATRSTVLRCVECGYSDREIHGELQPLSKLRPGKSVVHARDFSGSSMGAQGYQHWQQSAYLSESPGPGH